MPTASSHALDVVLLPLEIGLAVEEDATPGERGPAMVSDDHVVEDFDAEQVARLGKPAGDLLVVAGGFSVSGGVVVGDHDGGGAVLQCVAEEFPG